MRWGPLGEADLAGRELRPRGAVTWGIALERGWGQGCRGQGLGARWAAGVWVGARPGGSVEVGGALDCSERVFQTCPRKSKLVVAGAEARVGGTDGGHGDERPARERPHGHGDGGVGHGCCLHSPRGA